MKQVIEGYVVIFGIALLIMLSIAFTSINLNTAQARRIFDDIKTEMQASNGAFVPVDNPVYTWSSSSTIADDGFTFSYRVTRESLSGKYEDSTAGTYIYNDIYKIELTYVYAVPIFGRQIYPITGYAY